MSDLYEAIAYGLMAELRLPRGCGCRLEAVKFTHSENFVHRWELQMRCFKHMIFSILIQDDNIRVTKTYVRQRRIFQYDDPQLVEHLQQYIDETIPDLILSVKNARLHRVISHSRRRAGKR